MTASRKSGIATIGPSAARGARPRARRLIPVLALLMLPGCSTWRPLEIAREPVLSPVGAGITRPPIAEPVDLKGENGSFPVEPATSHNSLWRDRSADLFRDHRARRRGDILTVAVSIKDRASLDNSSKRSRDASHGLGLDLSHGIDWRGWTSEGTITANSNVKSNSAHDGKGEIARSENIDLRIAVVVTEMLPNGNLVIQGSQEVRVNFEMRVATFTGIVNIADIRADNTVPYERIAEARMSYGGRGRMTEVQQPGWGHQIVDQLSPF